MSFKQIISNLILFYSFTVTHKMRSVPLIFFFTWNVIISNEISLALAGDECSSNSDCSSGSVCCAGINGKSCQFSSCFDHDCKTDGDCGGVAECCRSKKCVQVGCLECHSNSYCASSEYCCQHRYIDDHNVCRRSCVGETCHSSRDCGGPGEYCGSNKICKKSAIYLAGWVIPVSVVGSIFFAIVSGGIFLHRWFQRPSRRQTVVNPVGTTAAAIAHHERATRDAVQPPVYNRPVPYFNQAKVTPTQP